MEVVLAGVSYRNAPSVTLFRALVQVTLFRMSTLEDWTDIMYINMYGCLSYGYDSNDMMMSLCNNSALGFKNQVRGEMEVAAPKSTARMSWGKRAHARAFDTERKSTRPRASSVRQSPSSLPLSASSLSCCRR